MRIAIISDIHANVLALQAVFADMQSYGIDQIVNAGDILYGPLWPSQTYEFLQKYSAITIKGNQDREIYEATSDDLNKRPILRYTVNDLEDKAIEWLKSLPETKTEGDLFICHGTPENDLAYLLEDVSSGAPFLRNDSVILSLLDSCNSRVIVCGHTHIPRMVRLSTGQIIVNPGSVGLQAYIDDFPVKHRMQTYSPDASYAIIENNKNDWTVLFRRVAYDHAAAAKHARQLGNNSSEIWASWLETGRADN